MTSTIHASLLMLCTPLLITNFAFWILKEKITIFKAAGLALGIGGAVLLILSKEKAGNNTSSLTGDIFIIQSVSTMGAGWTVSGAGSEVRFTGFAPVLLLFTVQYANPFTDPPAVLE